MIVLGPRLCTLRAGSRSEDLADHTVLRYELGRLVELARWRRLFSAGTSLEELAALVAAFSAFTPHPHSEIARDAELLRSRLPVTHRKRLAERLADLPTGALDPAAYLAACHRAADRAGLLACGDVAVAVELAGGAAAAPHLIQLAATRSYLAARRKLRVRDTDDVTSPFSRV